MINGFKVGQQVEYVPPHARGYINHPDIQYGFVMADKGEFCWVRYWYPDGSLRTKAGSENTPKEYLQKYCKYPQKKIDEMIVAIRTLDGKLDYYNDTLHEIED